MVLNFRDLDYIRVNPMRRRFKPTIRAPKAVLAATFTQRTAMSINAARIVALGAKMTRRHPRHGLQNHAFILRKLILMRVVAVDIWTFSQ